MFVLSMQGFPSGKGSACDSPETQEMQIQSWARKIPWRRKWQPTPVFLPGKIPQTEEAGIVLLTLFY